MTKDCGATVVAGKIITTVRTRKNHESLEQTCSIDHFFVFVLFYQFKQIDQCIRFAFLTNLYLKHGDKIKI